MESNNDKLDEKFWNGFNGDGEKINLLETMGLEGSTVMGSAVAGSAVAVAGS